MDFSRISKLSITVLLLSFFLFPNSIYSQYTDFEISDISVYINGEIDIQETRLYRDKHMGKDVKMIEYPDSDLIELEGLGWMLRGRLDSPPEKLRKVGIFGNSYRKEEIEKDIESRDGSIVDIVSVLTFSLKTSFFRIIGGELSVRISPSEEVYIEEENMTFDSTEFKIEMEIIDN